MARIAVIRTLPVKAEVVGWRYKKRLEDIAFRDVIDLCGHIEDAAHDRHRPTEAQYPGSELMSVNNSIYDGPFIIVL